MKGLKWMIGALLVVAVGGYGYLVHHLKEGTRATARQIEDGLAPIRDALRKGPQPSPAALLEAARAPLLRNSLYRLLQESGRAELFPRDFLNQRSFAESDLFVWLVHPNELGARPSQLELTQVVLKPSPRGRKLRYYVFRFKTEPGHWAAKYGWMAGVAGPYSSEEDLSLTAPGTNSELEPYDSRTPEAHAELGHQVALKSGLLE